MFSCGLPCSVIILKATKNDFTVTWDKLKDQTLTVNERFLVFAENLRQLERRHSQVVMLRNIKVHASSAVSRRFDSQLDHLLYVIALLEKNMM